MTEIEIMKQAKEALLLCAPSIDQRSATYKELVKALDMIGNYFLKMNSPEPDKKYGLGADTTIHEREKGEEMKTYSEMASVGEGIEQAFVGGWTIKSVGMTRAYECVPSLFPGYHCVEGGLTFVLEKNGQVKKVILGYTELGEWIEHIEILK